MKRLILAISMLVVASNGLAQVKETNPHNGSVSLPLKYVYATNNNGSPAPEHEKDCQKLLQSYVNTKIATTYSINTENGMQSATSTFLVPGDQKPTVVKLSSLGIDGVHAFMGTSGDKEVFFQLDKKLKNPKNFIMFVQKDSTYNCNISTNKDF